MTQWNYLEIHNVPNDFFVNEKYEIETKPTKYILSSKNWEKCDSSVEKRILIINTILTKNNKSTFRYRIKPKKPIVITRNIMKLLYQFSDVQIEQYCKGYLRWNESELEFLDGHPVEIIEE